MAKAITILVAEDDAEDRLLVRDSWAQNRVASDLRFVEDGEELLDYLNARGKYARPGTAPRPGLILLDLNMPRKDGREALNEIKADPVLRWIPVIILTSSKAEEDVLRSYDLGASFYITKPVTFDKLAEVVRILGYYWIEVATLPGQSR